MKLKLKIPDRAKYVMDLLEKHDHEIYIVGGVVRDILLERPQGDWDFTTSATPEEILQLVPDSYYDNKYGTVGIKTDDRPYEITTYRTEFGYSDGRHPDEVAWGKTLEEDLARRDFTINAMALRPDKKGVYEIVDPYKGQDDLKSGLIRTVGNPNKRFSEDGLRMMRAIRIAAQLKFAIEEETFLAIKANSEKLAMIAGERIREELLKILASEYPVEGYELLRNTNLGQIVLPEMEKTFGVEQKSPGRHHIYDVGKHSLEALRHCPSPDPITRLATLIHDIGKVKTQRIYPDGKITFYNHEMESARIAEMIADRLRFSNDQKDKLVRLVRWHQFTVDERQTDSAIRRFIKNVGVDLVPEMLALRVGDRLGGGARETSWRLEEFKIRLVEVQKQPFAIPDLKITGKDVMEVKRIDPGPKVGQYLQQLFDEVVENKLINEKEALLIRLREINN